MIPVRASDLDALVAEAERQVAEVREVFAELSPEAATWRPDETRWSVTGHVTHVVIINRAYLGAIEAAIDRAEEKGPRGDGPYRHPAIAKWFVRNMEPPPKQRMKTMRSMVPDPGADPERAEADFAAVQERMGSLLERARGLDLGRVRFGSPFFRLLRFSLGAGFEMLLAHNRRHLWLAREVMGSPGFPGGAGNG